MRPASFYIGVVVLGTVAPFALATWAPVVTDVHRTAFQTVVVARGAATSVEHVPGLDRGGRLLGRHIEAGPSRSRCSGRGSSAGRSRSIRRSPAPGTMFWRAIAATVIAAAARSSSKRGSRPSSGRGRHRRQHRGRRRHCRGRAVRRPVRVSPRRGRLGDCRSVVATRRSFRVYRAERWPRSWWPSSEPAAAAPDPVRARAPGWTSRSGSSARSGSGPDSGALGVILVTVRIVSGDLRDRDAGLHGQRALVAPQVVMFVGLPTRRWGWRRCALAATGTPATRDPASAGSAGSPGR